jgi:SET domain-containing protein
LKPLAFIDDLKRRVFCRLGVSPIHGVGVFAIRPIPAGINPMQGRRSCNFIDVPVTLVRNDPSLPNTLKKLVVDMCPEEEGKFWCPPFSLNEIGIAWYLNHSKTPNMTERDGDFYTARAIAEGEELTVDYELYGELNL